MAKPPKKSRKMTDFFKFLQKIGLDVWFFTAGLLGSLLNIKKRNGLTIKQQIIAIFSGGITAAYLTPLAVEIFKLSDYSAYGVAFFIGSIGLNSVEAIFNKKIKNEPK